VLGPELAGAKEEALNIVRWAQLCARATHTVWLTHAVMPIIAVGATMLHLQSSEVYGIYPCGSPLHAPVMALQP
jgi:hypothetical protein